MRHAAAVWATAAALLCGVAGQAPLTAGQPGAPSGSAGGTWKFVKPNEPGTAPAAPQGAASSKSFGKRTDDVGNAASAKLSWKRPGVAAPTGSVSAPVRQVVAHERLKQDKLSPQRDVSVSSDEDDPFENPFDDETEPQQAAHVEADEDHDSNCKRCATFSRLPDKRRASRVQRAGALEEDELPPLEEEPALQLDADEPAGRARPAPLEPDNAAGEDGGPDLPDSTMAEEEDEEDILSKELAQAPGAPTGPCPSPADLKKITEITDNIRAEGKVFPQECTLGNSMYCPRNFALTTYTWKASALCHKPLYFEQVAVERYGHTWPLIQPVVSAAHFFCTVPILPYKMGIEPPTECIYALGYYEPGSCAPYMIYPIPITVRAGLMEAGAWVGGVFLIP